MAENNEGVRIQKVISDAGAASRRQAETLIREGRVKVNGRPATIGMKIDPKTHMITIDGERLMTNIRQQKYYIAVYKPRGYVTTVKDELGRKAVTKLVEDIPARLYPVGRLDLNSEGLLIMTNDGEFANMLMHPRHEIEKTYRATTSMTVSDEQLVALSEGVEIDGKRTLPAIIRVITKETGRTVLQITIREGRNRQIRKMFEAVGLDVRRLRRIQVGPVRLGMMKPGTYRELTKTELDVLRQQAGRALGE